MRRRHLIPAALAALALVAAGCGDDDQKFASAIDGDPTTTLPASLADTTTSTTPSRDANEPLPKATTVTVTDTDLSKKPNIPKPSGNAPDELQATDVVAGKGAAVKSGDTVQVDYVGVLHKNGKEFDTSWGKQPFPFTVGQGGVIEGWDQGIVGMKVGGRRLLVIPPELAYGSTGQPPTIGANEALVFVVDLKKIA